VGALELAFQRVAYIPCERGGKFLSCRSELEETEMEGLEWR
jgi:hypothetical protein